MLSTLLKSATRPGDELVRFGGDEFVVILLDAALDQALVVSERLREKVEEFRFLENGMTFRIGASIGIAPVNPLLNASELLVAADTACYAAKAGGRNRVEVYSEKDSSLAQLIADTDWATRIGEAMKDGSLELWFQPIVNTRTRELLYQEALLRYIDPGQTIIVSPGAFLNSAQRSGQGAKLDRFVIERAVTMLEEDPLLSVGVNLSAPSFNDRELIDFVANLLSSRNVGAHRLFLEITESEIMSNLDRARDVLEALKSMGILIALDDFGAGFSSLAYLKNLPVDFLKIDGSFIRDIHNNAFNQAIIRAIREVASIRDIRTVAEYVENVDQLDLLAELGVDFAQGFLIGKPRSRSYRISEMAKPPSGE
jgi:EAL domain-containing protein (putative c-di-GMP-specific phosphodiesterase class I)